MHSKFFKSLFLLFVLSIAFVSAQEEDPRFDPEKNPYEVPEYEPNGRFYTEVFSMLSTLGLIIVALIIISWFFKKMMSTRIQQMNITSDFKILDSRAVSTKLNVHLIEVHNKEILFAESTTGIEKLAEFSNEARNFEDVMKSQDAS